MVARGLLRKTLFPPSLVSCLRYQLFLLSRTSILQAISKGKHSFKPLCWNVNENCDVDGRRGITPAIILKQKQEKSTLQVFFVLFTWPVSPSGIYGTLLLPLMLLTTTAKKKTLFADLFACLRVELRALLISVPPSRVRKGRFCKFP